MYGLGKEKSLLLKIFALKIEKATNIGLDWFFNVNRYTHPSEKQPI